VQAIAANAKDRDDGNDEPGEQSFRVDAAKESGE